MGTIMSVWAKVTVITLIKAPHCLKGYGRVLNGRIWHFNTEYFSLFGGARTVVSVSIV